MRDSYERLHGAEAESDDVFTAEDLKESDHYETLGPAYFASRRMAEALMAGVGTDDLKKATDKVVEDVRSALYDYVEIHFKSDLEENLRHHMQDMVERSIRALLTGEEWALRQYPMAAYADGESVRAAVAKHGGEPLLMKRIEDLEKRNTELSEALTREREYSSRRY